MADSINQIGLAYPQDFVLESCVITTALGQPMEFRNMVVELNYFEDLFGNAISGNLILNDSSGMLNVMGFCGNEYLILAFGKPGLDTNKISKTFRIFGVSNRSLVKDQNENYILNFCSEENVLSEQYKISKSYPNKKISEIVSDIVINQLGTKPDKFKPENLEETRGVRDIIIPNLKPFEAINWLSTHAISSSAKNTGSTYLFYENYNGFNFKSLQSLYGGKVYKVYKYEPKNTNDPNDPRVQNLDAEMVNVFSFEHLSNFHFIDSTNSGAFANRLISVDPLRQNYSVTDYDYFKETAKKETWVNRLNPGFLISNAKNRKGDTANTTFNAVVKTVTTNTGQSTFSNYIRANQPGIKDVNIESTVPVRTAELAQLNTVRFKISVPGDPLLTVGMVIEFLLPELRTLENGQRMWDHYYSGRFLITAVRHVFNQENKYTTMLEISKESLQTSYYPFNNDLPSWKELRSR